MKLSRADQRPERQQVCYQHSSQSVTRACRTTARQHADALRTVKRWLRLPHLLRTSKTRMAWCDPSALPDSLMITGAGSMPRSMQTSCRHGRVELTGANAWISHTR